MKIKDISDVITNSSSEVFIIKPDKTKRGHSDPMRIIIDVCEALGINPEEIMIWETSTKDGIAETGWPESRCKKGDLIIRSKEENSIPYPLSDLIEGIDLFDSSIKSVNRIKLG